MDEISKSIKLNNGLEMPRYGLGTLLVKDLPNIIYIGIKSGVRLFDTALVYQNEKEVGEGIKKAIEDKLVTREELFISTKVWVTHRNDPEACLKSQLQVLGLDYVDVYLDHAPVAIAKDTAGNVIKVPLHVFWTNMEGLVKKGLAKSIGVCNYNVQSLLNLLSFCEIKPVVNQFELHPYLTQPGLVRFCKENNIAIMAYNTMGKNFYVEKFHKNSNLSLIDDKVVIEVAQKNSKTPGLILLNWAISHDFIVLPSTSNPERFKENLQCLTFKLSDEDLEKLDKLNIPYRFGISATTPGTPDIYA
jgi:diketogulonate reductase-like aldo/keto reductase